MFFEETGVSFRLRNAARALKDLKQAGAEIEAAVLARRQKIPFEEGL